MTSKLEDIDKIAVVVKFQEIEKTYFITRENIYLSRY